MNYQHKLNHYREFYSFHEYQQVMRLIYSIDTYVNNILEMNLGDDIESALIFAFIDQNEIAIKEAIGRLTLFGQDVEDDEIAEDEDDDKCGCCVKGVGFIDSNGRNVDLFNLPYTDDDEIDLEDDFAEDEDDDDDDFACGCCDRWVEHVCIGPGRFYVEGFGIIDSNGKLVEEDDVPYTDDDEMDLEDDFADDEEEGFVDDEEDDERDLYLLRKLIRGIRAILKELEL